jgi:UDP-2,3-diacylglucosamine pyrophosphatase LpxH
MMRYLNPGRLFFCGMVLLACLPVQAQQLVHRVVLIGDAGELKNGVQPVTEAVLSAGILSASSTIIYLGDNIYPKGLPATTAATYAASKTILEAQLKPARQTTAQVYFIPGNHDWANSRSDGWETVIRQQRYLDSTHLPNVRLLPANGCPGPEVIELAPGLVLVIINSQWWLHRGDKPGIASDCDCKTREEVSVRLKDIAWKYRNDKVIIASHHPFKTHGTHGGYFTPRQHLFPLTDINKKLWIPLPLLGSIYPLSRSAFGNIQDTRHPVYQNMIQQVTGAFKQHRAAFFVHGHDHTLQHLRVNNQNYIVSGSAIKQNPVRKGKATVFAGNQNGYAVLDYMSDSTMWLRFYNAQNKLLHQYEEKRAGVATTDTATNSITATGADRVSVAAGTQYDKAGRLKRLLFGEIYRKVWATPVNFRVLRLTTEKGGLKALQRGGGKQTKSLRLEDATGKQWVIRSINKNPISALPPVLRETFAVDIVQDQIAAAHPYAPLVVPVLAAAAGIPYTNPELVWIAADTALGQYQPDFANTLCLFEEREPGITGKSYATAKVLEKLEEDNDNGVDQQAVLKARLFDLFIGDFDRHEDQWRWGAVKTEKGNIFYPVPRDRDQAFFINNGWLTWLAAAPHLVPSVQGFQPKFRNINTFNFSTRYFDRNFLNRPGEQDWRQAAEAMMAAMTDAVIDSAVSRLPANIDSISGNALRKTLKAKRQYFVADVMQYYRFLAQTIEVTGSDKKERFILSALPNGHVWLRVYKLSKKDKESSLLYERHIDPVHTRELRLYGLDGADEFITDSAVRAKIRLRIIGGTGEDHYTTPGQMPTLIYDWKGEANQLAGSASAKLRTSDDPAVNRYDRTAFRYNLNIPQFVAGFNADDGVSLGAGIKMIRHGFRKTPAAIYQLMASHSLSTRAFRLRGSARFTDVLGKTGLQLYADIKSPNNTTNFFGYGNGSVYPNPGKNTFRFHRARYNLLEAGADLVSRPVRSIQLQYGLGYQFFSMDADDNARRYILQTAINGLAGDNIFQRKYYFTSHVDVIVDDRNNPNIPTRGIYWTTGLAARRGLNAVSRNTLALQTDLRLYAAFDKTARLTLAARFGAGHTWGDLEFFQAQQLGGHDNLRGYRNHRFAGRSMVYSNVELRMKLFDFSGYLFPGSVGLIGFNDVGRVWYKNDVSATWHNTPGAGLYLAPAGLIAISATVGFSEEEILPVVSLGFRF